MYNVLRMHFNIEVSIFINHSNNTHGYNALLMCYNMCATSVGHYTYRLIASVN